jgi:aminopeptidase N
MAIDATSSFWNVAIAEPEPTGLFRSPVYDRGAATLHATREDRRPRVLRGARQWLRRYDNGDATTEDFEAIYEKASRQDLSTFFDVWLRRTVKPTEW